MCYCCATGNCPRCQAVREAHRPIEELLAKIKTLRETPSRPEDWRQQCQEIYETPGHVWLGAIEMLMDKRYRS